MNRALASICTLLTAAAMALPVFGANARGGANLNLDGKKVSVDYGRPSLNGRSIESQLGRLPVGEVWRLGADQSTTFETNSDLNFGDVTVPKGTYSLWARKEADGGWKLVFNQQHGQWGTIHDASKDLYAVPLKMEKEDKPADLVTITLEKENGEGEFSVTWGSMELSATFK